MRDDEGYLCSECLTVWGSAQARAECERADRAADELARKGHPC